MHHYSLTPRDIHQAVFALAALLLVGVLVGVVLAGPLITPIP